MPANAAAAAAYMRSDEVNFRVQEQQATPPCPAKGVRLGLDCGELGSSRHTQEDNE